MYIPSICHLRFYSRNSKCPVWTSKTDELREDNSAEHWWCIGGDTFRCILFTLGLQGRQEREGKPPLSLALWFSSKVTAYLKRTNYQQGSGQAVKRRVFRNASHADTILGKRQSTLALKKLIAWKTQIQNILFCVDAGYERENR
jgi:hypothetical protein